MKLMTKALEKRFKQVGSQEKTATFDKIVIAKFFNPGGAGRWYAIEYDPEEKLFFGYVSIFGDWNDEWGYFTLEELEAIRGNLGLKIERDLYCGEQTIREHKINSMRV